MYNYGFKQQAKRTANGFKFTNQRVLLEKWALEMPDINEYRIHRSYLTDFRNHFKNFDIAYIVESTAKADDVTIKLIPSFDTRGDQGEWLDFLAQDDYRHLSLPATMGAGKTVTFLAAASAYGKRTAVMIPPGLSDRWLLEIFQFTLLDKKEVLYVAGGQILKGYMTTLEEGRNPWVLVLFSINTIRNYVRDYYLNPDEWIYSPEELFRVAGFGLRGIDEAHKELHFHYMTTLFFNCGKYIGLSGTLPKENEFLNDMCDRLFPREGRCPIKPVVATTECAVYKLYFDRWIPKHKGAMGYSQVLYENQLRVHPTIRAAFFLYLARIIYQEFNGYTKDPNDKILIFMGTIKLADMFSKYLQCDRKVRDHFSKFKIGRLRRGEPDSKAKALNIVVTTVGRAGTGTDIPGILTVFNTIAINDGYLQRQVLGRSRPREDQSTRFVRIYSPNISKHNAYHVKSLAKLRDLCTSVTIHELANTMPNPTGDDYREAKRILSEERKASDLKKKEAKLRKAIRLKRSKM